MSEYQCSLFFDKNLLLELGSNEEKIIRQEGLEFIVFDFSQLPAGTQFNGLSIKKAGAVFTEKSFKTKTFQMHHKQIRYNIKSDKIEIIGVIFNNRVGRLLPKQKGQIFILK